jgi:hypothetical protein
MRFRDNLENIAIWGLYKLADGIRYVRSHAEGFILWSLISIVVVVYISTLIGQDLEKWGWPDAYVWSSLGTTIWALYVWGVVLWVLNHD